MGKKSKDFQKLSGIVPITGKVPKKVNCSKHGEYEATTHFVLGRWMESKCPGCILEADKEIDIKTDKTDLLSNRRENMRFDTYRVSNDDQRNVFDRCHRFVNNFKKVLELGSSMVLTGNPGTGKTHLATAIFIDLYEQGFGVGYYLFYELMLRIKATYGRGVSETEDGIIKRLSGYDLLILDEVGLKSFSETETALAYQIINKRYEAVKPTILVTNLSIVDLEAALGTRTVDRLYENHGAVLVFGWESMRRSSTK